MRTIRSFVAQSPAIAISLAALVFSLGGGAGYAATVATQSEKITFHRLHLIHQWHPNAMTRAGQTSGLGFAPAVGISNEGIVYLSGSLSRSTPDTGANGVFAILPKGMRPAVQQDVTVTTVGGTTAVMQITPDGQLFVFGPNAPEFTSLDGVSFAING
jgi:hypothetical protein